MSPRALAWPAVLRRGLPILWRMPALAVTGLLLALASGFFGVALGNPPFTHVPPPGHHITPRSKATAVISSSVLISMPDIFAALHAGGLITGPAIILVLLASVATRNLEVITSAVLLILFVLVTSPLATSAIAQAEHRRERGEVDPAADEDEVGAAR